MIGLRYRRRKHDGYRVTDDAIERAFMAKGDADHFIKIRVE